MHHLETGFEKSPSQQPQATKKYIAENRSPPGKYPRLECLKYELCKNGHTYSLEMP